MTDFQVFAGFLKIIRNVLNQFNSWPVWSIVYFSVSSDAYRLLVHGQKFFLVFQNVCLFGYYKNSDQTWLERAGAVLRIWTVGLAARFGIGEFNNEVDEALRGKREDEDEDRIFVPSWILKNII